MNEYNPFDWYWLVEETNKYWSSKLSTYTDVYDKDSLTIIDTEKNLSDVLEIYNLQGPYKIIPKFVTMYQARAALIQAGLFDQIDSLVKAKGVDSLEYQAWEYATNFYRDSAFIVTLATQIGLTPQQIDQLFITANTIQ